MKVDNLLFYIFVSSNEKNFKNVDENLILKNAFLSRFKYVFS